MNCCPRSPKTMTSIPGERPKIQQERQSLGQDGVTIPHPGSESSAATYARSILANSEYSAYASLLKANKELLKTPGRTVTFALSVVENCGHQCLNKSPNSPRSNLNTLARRIESDQRPSRNDSSWNQEHNEWNYLSGETQEAGHATSNVAAAETNLPPRVDSLFQSMHQIEHNSLQGSLCDTLMCSPCSTIHSSSTSPSLWPSIMPLPFATDTNKVRNFARGNEPTHSHSGYTFK